jgi:uncharacterized protein (UPF0332 family)
MEANTIEECIKLRLLRKTKIDLDKSRKSLELSEKAIKETESALGSPFFKYAILNAYMAMFHSSRSVLYSDGVQEKSHYAIFIYLKEKYSNAIPISILNLLNIHRIERHEAMYGLEYEPTLEEAELALKDAKQFVGEIKRLMKGRLR